MRHGLAGTALAGLLLAVTIWGFVEALFGGATLEAPAGAEAAAASLGPRLQPGDVVVVSPPLALLSSSALSGLPAIGSPPPSRGLSGRATRVFELVLDGAESSLPEAPEDFVPGDEEAGDGFRLLRFDPRGGATVGARLVDRVGGASAALVPREGDVQPCGASDGARFSCGSEPWMHPGRVAARVSGAIAACIWAHPVEGRALRLTFPDIELGSAIGGRMALVDGTGAGTDVEVTFSRGGEPLGRAVLPGKPAGWKEISVKTPGRSGERGELVMDVSSKSARWRKVCLDPIIQGAEEP